MDGQRQVPDSLTDTFQQGRSVPSPPTATSRNCIDKSRVRAYRQRTLAGAPGASPNFQVTH